ncbi:MAG: hypothetical protein VKJ06_03985 [Vampirovibrionales bacterium]|nr:hypothetical protein [Vampirovibrionales bacterium]
MRLKKNIIRALLSASGFSAYQRWQMRRVLALLRQALAQASTQTGADPRVSDHPNRFISVAIGELTLNGLSPTIQLQHHRIAQAYRAKNAAGWRFYLPQAAWPEFLEALIEYKSQLQPKLMLINYANPPMVKAAGRLSLSGWRLLAFGEPQAPIEHVLAGHCDVVMPQHCNLSALEPFCTSGPIEANPNTVPWLGWALPT